MASNNLNVISDMKQTVLRAILSDADIVKIIRNRGDVAVPDMGLRYTQVFPWAYVPDAIEETKTYIGFEVAVTNIQNCAAKEYSLRVYVMAHKTMMRMNSDVCTALGLNTKDCGTRIDVLADKIDWLLNGSEDMGFTRMELESSGTFSPAEEFIGRSLIYRVVGWNRWGEKL